MILPFCSRLSCKEFPEAFYMHLFFKSFFFVLRILVESILFFIVVLFSAFARFWNLVLDRFSDSCLGLFQILMVSSLSSVFRICCAVHFLFVYFPIEDCFFISKFCFIVYITRGGFE